MLALPHTGRASGEYSMCTCLMSSKYIYGAEFALLHFSNDLRWLPRGLHYSLLAPLIVPHVVRAPLL